MTIRMMMATISAFDFLECTKKQDELVSAADFIPPSNDDDSSIEYLGANNVNKPKRCFKQQ